MRKSFFLVLIALTVMIGCKNQKKESELKEMELQLQQKELELKQKEQSLNSVKLNRLDIL